MTGDEIERRIRENDFSGLTEEKFATVEKQEFSFYKNYLHSSEDSKEMLLAFLQHINQPWCFRYYLELLKDPAPSIRSSAAQGILSLGKDVDAEMVLSEIIRLNSGNEDDRIYGIAALALAVGNSRDGKYLEPLLVLYQKETDSDIRSAYFKALAKLGYQKFIREIEHDLVFADGRGKQSALLIVSYLKDPIWIEKIKPLLLDEDSSLSYPLGKKTVLFRICDLTINVLREIDPENKITFATKTFHYLPEELKAVRKIYGVPEKQK